MLLCLTESYLLAFCESDRKEELLKLLEVLDISKISSFNHVATIFKSLGRTQLQKFAEKFILELKTTGIQLCVSIYTSTLFLMLLHNSVR